MKIQESMTRYTKILYCYKSPEQNWRCLECANRCPVNIGSEEDAEERSE